MEKRLVEWQNSKAFLEPEEEKAEETGHRPLEGAKIFVSDLLVPPSDPQEAGDTSFKAGLLTPGSSDSPNLPDPAQDQWLFGGIPDYSGGPVSDFNGIPY